MNCCGIGQASDFVGDLPFCCNHDYRYIGKAAVRFQFFEHFCSNAQTYQFFFKLFSVVIFAIAIN